MIKLKNVNWILEKNLKASDKISSKDMAVL